jgi:hypothetical protein
MWHTVDTLKAPCALPKKNSVPPVPRFSIGKVRELRAQRIDLASLYVAIEWISSHSIPLNPIEKKKIPQE